MIVYIYDIDYDAEEIENLVGLSKYTSFKRMNESP